MKLRRRLIVRIVFTTCIGVVCLLLSCCMLWSIPCNNQLPVSFTINETGKSDKQIAEEVFSRYLDQSIFPHSCPVEWISQYQITDIRRTTPIDQMAWAVSYEIPPFLGNDFDSGNSLPNGNLSKFRIIFLKREGNVYPITRFASGG